MRKDINKTVSQSHVVYYNYILIYFYVSNGDPKLFHFIFYFISLNLYFRHFPAS